ncbi:pre-toxin TG domain-containing protein [Listeria seeligeri]|uniref:pre-toxin TG domain-containing protein n=1 Tax=Listeria seeligeri TaxID=1640 RepID=UPI0018881572|nr:pre-toxin TG domain-containing protein [Listeria seeligeri]MBF2564805.1 hypothetical protein [Listeria seeligeri]
MKAIKEMADLFTPIGDGARVVTGEDPITGNKLSWGERGLSALFIIPLGKIGKYGGKGFKFVTESVEDINKINKKVDKVKEVEKSTKKASGAKIPSLDSLSDELASTLGGKASPLKTDIKLKFRMKKKLLSSELWMREVEGEANHIIELV